VISESFQVGGQEHFYIEGQVALALPEEKGGMTVYSSTQHPTEIQHCIAKMLKVPDAMVTCECRRMGGAFGGKESQAAQWAACCPGPMSRGARPRPPDRDQDMMMTGRHDFRGRRQGRPHPAVDVEFPRCGYLSIPAVHLRPHHVPCG
jgi:xanthine dehydrogenase large subunit